MAKKKAVDPQPYPEMIYQKTWSDGHTVYVKVPIFDDTKWTQDDLEAFDKAMDRERERHYDNMRSPMQRQPMRHPDPEPDDDDYDDDDDC